MGFVDGLERAFNPIAGFLRKRWLKTILWVAAVVYLVVILGPIFGGRWLYTLIEKDLLSTGAFTNPYYLEATAFALTVVSLIFLPTILGLWLRLKQRIASAIAGGVFTLWIILLGILSGHSSGDLFGALDARPQCNYFVNAEGKVLLRPKAYLVDKVTGDALSPVTPSIVLKWLQQNPGETPTCNSPENSVYAPPKRITIVDAHNMRWFGPSGPLVWYVRDTDGTVRYYDGPGIDPVTGADLIPVTKDIVIQAEQLQDDAVKQAQALHNQQVREEAAIVARTHAAEERVAAAAKMQRESAQRGQNGSAATTALQAGEYDRALIDCPDMKGTPQADPCAKVRQQAMGMKAAQLATISQQEVQEYRLDDAIRDAKQALDLDPNNGAAKKTLRLAQTLKQQSGENSPR